jgi:plasmid stabilization system protein ParE
MKIIWPKLAEDSLISIYNYYRQVAGISIAKKIRSEILASTRQLREHPNSGQIEEVLEQLREGHRYLVKNHHKIIYKPIMDGILITDVFDTRQDPIKMNNPKRI